jgi:hypothetical protein
MTAAVIETSNKMWRLGLDMGSLLLNAIRACRSYWNGHQTCSAPSSFDAKVRPEVAINAGIAKRSKRTDFEKAGPMNEHVIVDDVMKPSGKLYLAVGIFCVAWLAIYCPIFRLTVGVRGQPKFSRCAT